MSRKTVIRIAVLLVAVLFIVIGVSRDEASMVLKKGRDICLSCIGIG